VDQSHFGTVIEFQCSIGCVMSNIIVTAFLHLSSSNLQRFLWKANPNQPRKWLLKYVGYIVVCLLSVRCYQPMGALGLIHFCSQQVSIHSS